MHLLRCCMHTEIILPLDKVLCVVCVINEVTLLSSSCLPWYPKY